MSAGRFDGHLVLVTGGGSGLGEADAKLFAEEGAVVIVADIDVANGERVAGEIGGSATFVRLDVSDETAWQALMGDIAAKHGRLDVLVNNAGVSGVSTPESITGADLKLAWDVSVAGTIYGCKHAIPLLKKSEHGGAIVNMSSITAIRGEPFAAAYTAAKGAISAYTRSLAVYCAQSGIPIRANAVLPAAIDTPMVGKFADEFRDRAIQPLREGREDSVPPVLGHPRDVAALVAFLASRDARFLSGQSIVLDNTASVTIGSVPAF